MRAFILAVLAAAALAGCGSSSDGDRASPPSPPTPPAPTTTAAPKAKLAPPCARRARAVLARAAGASAGSIDAGPYTARSSAAACRLAASTGGPSVIVMLDSAPQPYTRLEREVVEYGQNVVHSGARAYPRTVKRLGLDADWFASENRLLTTDGVRLITVKVRWAAADTGAREALAVRLARVYLGPPQDPYG